jgi:ABC-type transport system involved in Fe-S cluster assembly fused permease/ATPase subunit
MQVQKALIDMENMFELLATVPGVLDVKGASALQVRDGQVDFQDVVFGYNSAQPVLKGVSLTAAGGSTLAVVGSTGSGKSTILR